MILGSGKFEGKTSFEVVLKHADYVQWYISEYPDSRNGREFKRLINRFDDKPFITNCYTCKRPATRATVYQQTYDFMYWCDDCDPYGSGARSGTLTVVKTYGEALRHADYRCNGHKEWKRETIKDLARGKGLPKRITVGAAEPFFA